MSEQPLVQHPDVLSVRIPVADHLALVRYCKQSGRVKGWVVAQAIREWLEKNAK